VPPRLGRLVPRLGRASVDRRSPLGRVPPPRLGRPVAAVARPFALRNRPAWAACSLGQAELGRFRPKEFWLSFSVFSNFNNQLHAWKFKINSRKIIKMPNQFCLVPKIMIYLLVYLVHII